LKTTDGIQQSYDAVADAYAAAMYRELDGKPLDRELLDWLVERAAPLGPICDLGCGPGQIAAYLNAHGAAVCGVDLSAGMVRVARTLLPGVSFEQGDLRALDAPEASYGGIAAFYSIIHIPREDVPVAFAEFRRVLKPGGVALISCHLGDGDIGADDFLVKGVRFDGHLYQRAQIRDWLEQAGLRVTEAIERDPYPGVEHASRRLYVYAQK
jgi:SAM-dependent methyltransferase